VDPVGQRDQTDMTDGGSAAARQEQGNPRGQPGSSRASRSADSRCRTSNSTTPPQPGSCYAPTDRRASAAATTASTRRTGPTVYTWPRPGFGPAGEAGHTAVVFAVGDGDAASMDCLLSIDFLPDGRLLIVSTVDRRVLRRELDGDLLRTLTLRLCRSSPGTNSSLMRPVART